jgi:hypothetical protein
MAETVDLGFKIEKRANGRETEFEVPGAGLGADVWGWSVGIAVAVSLFINSFVHADAETDTPLVLTFLGIVGLTILLCALAHRGKSKVQFFSVSETEVIVRDKRYERAKVTEILITNLSDKGGSPVLVNPIVGGAIIGAARSIGSDIKSAVARRDYALSIRHGRNVVPVATDLEKDVAISLFHELSALIR